jgi:penicillin amidase
MFANAKENNHRLTLPDMAFLQNDVTSLAALEFQKLLQATPLKDDPSLRTFLKWDGELERKSGDAALYEVWLQQIQTGLADRFAKNRGVLQVLSGRYKDLPPDLVLGILRVPESDLFGESPTTDRNQLLADTLKSAREELSILLGPDASQWSWGKFHVVRFRHALDQQRGAKDLFDLGPLARPGDEYTPNATGMSDSWEQVSGASYRQIIDLSNWDRSWVINTPGQSGQPGSPHYSDLLQPWDVGRYFPLLYSRKAVEGETTDRLKLVP